MIQRSYVIIKNTSWQKKFEYISKPNRAIFKANSNVYSKDNVLVLTAGDSRLKIENEG